MKIQKGAKIYRPGQKISIVDDDGDVTGELTVLQNNTNKCTDCFFNGQGECQCCAEDQRDDHINIIFKETSGTKRHLLKVYQDGEIYRAIHRLYIDVETGTKLRLVKTNDNNVCGHCFYTTTCCGNTCCVDDYYFKRVE